MKPKPVIPEVSQEIYYAWESYLYRLYKWCFPRPINTSVKKPPAYLIKRKRILSPFLKKLRRYKKNMSMPCSSVYIYMAMLGFIDICDKFMDTADKENNHG